MGDKLKVAVIGGGSGGYPAAIRAARLGAEVALIENDLLGGVCLNRGCIPTKALLQSGEILKTIKDSGIFGIQCGDGKVDFRAVISRKNSVIQQLRRGVERLLAAKKIKIIKGTATLLDPSTVQILETEDKIKVDKIIIATGSRPIKLDINGFEGPDILDSDKFLEMEDLPKSVVIIGGGVIGVEFAQILNRMGVELTILELMENLVPEIDKEIAQGLEKSIIEEGIKVFTKAEIKGITHGKDLKTIIFTVGEESKKCKAERVIVSVGRRPDLSHLNVDTIGLAQENNTLIVNE
ncbi:MAG: FAD-dependent oxidoreductase, partial [Deltaproteobacteria bacterium]|nr:FAD-dependent oxidoreductase [Deltaproteobacteria bacterium]